MTKTILGIWAFISRWAVLSCSSTSDTPLWQLSSPMWFRSLLSQFWYTVYMEQSVSSHSFFLDFCLMTPKSPLQRPWSLCSKPRLQTGFRSFFKYLRAHDWITSPLSSSTATKVSVSWRLFSVTWYCFCVSRKGWDHWSFSKDRWQNTDVEFNSRKWETGKYVHHFNACK